MTTVINVVCAVIQNDTGKVLACQRPEGKSLAGKWEFPGGKMETGESPEDTLVREIREELGCEIEIISAMEGVPHDYGSFSIRLLPFLCMLKSKEVHLLEHTEIRWLDLDQCPKLDWADADIPIWRALLAEK